MKDYRNKYYIIFGLIAVSFLCGCKNKANRAGGDIAEEPIDTLAELAKHIEEYDDFGHFYCGAIKVKKDGYYGLINKLGKRIVECKYDDINYVEEGMWCCEHQGKYDLVDKNGGVIYDKDYSVDIFYNGYARIIKDELYGIIDRTGNEIVLPKYHSIGKYHDGLFLVGIEEPIYDDGSILSRALPPTKYGYIDVNGQVVIPLQYREADSFSEGYARVGNGEYYGYIDKQGNLRIDYKYKHNTYGGFHEGYAAEEDKYGRKLIVDKNGNETFLKVDVISWQGYFSEGLSWILAYTIDRNNTEYDYEEICNSEKYGYIDKYGNVSIPLIYDGADAFSEGFAAVRQGNSTDGKYAYIDRQGNQITPFLYSSGRKFKDGIALITRGGFSRHSYGYLDSSGKEVISPLDYDGVGYAYEGIVSVKKQGKWGYVDVNGTEIIPCIYDEVHGFCDGLSKVENNGKVGFVDKQGNSTFDFEE